MPFQKHPALVIELSLPGSPSVASQQRVSALRVPLLGLQGISACCGKGQFEVHEGDLCGAQDFVVALELQTTGG